MDLKQLTDKLLAAARANPPADHVPYAFEKRVMARLAAKTAIDEWGWWARALWRAAAACVGVSLLASAWSFLPAAHQKSARSAVDLEETVLSAVNDAAEVNW